MMGSSILEGSMKGRAVSSSLRAQGRAEINSLKCLSGV